MNGKQLTGFLIGLAGLALMVAGCAGTYSPVSAGLYTDVKHGGEVGSGEPATKTGESCAQQILGIVATGDASIEGAKTAGGISKVSYVDHRTKIILSSSYGQYCTVVHGN